MSSTGFVIVGTGNEEQRSGTLAWSNETNVTADDGSVASSASSSAAGEKTWTLYGHNLGLSLPDGAVIRGIEARIEARNSGNPNSFDDVVLRKADGTFTTTDRSDAATLTGTLTAYTYGSATDLWGESWTKADVEDADFGAGFAFLSANASAAVETDYIALNVHYDLDLTPITGLSRVAGANSVAEDTFAIDSTDQYTQYADTAGTWAVSGGELVATGGAQSLFIRDGTSYTDVAIEADINHAYDGGLILRFIDNNNYYLLAIRDDSGAVPTTNLALFRRVAGSFTGIVGVNITWTRGDSKTIRFQVDGATLTAYVDGSLLVTATDSSHAGPGGVGMRNNTAGEQTKFQAFRWNQARAAVELGQDVFPIDGLARVQGDTPAVELALTPQAGLMRMIGQEPTTAEETGGLWGKSGAASGTWGKAGASGSGSWGKAPIAH